MAIKKLSTKEIKQRSRPAIDLADKLARRLGAIVNALWQAKSEKNE